MSASTSRTTAPECRRRPLADLERAFWGAREQVLVPESARELADLVSWAEENEVPVVPAGAGAHAAIANAPAEDALIVSLESFASIAHWLLGWNLMFLGDLVPARTHLEQAAACRDPEQHRSSVLLTGHDIGVVALICLSWTLWFLGYPDQALDRLEEALALARELRHAPSRALGQALLRHDGRAHPPRLSARRTANGRGIRYRPHSGIQDRGPRNGAG